LSAKLQDLLNALPVRVLKRIQRLSKESGESVETVIESALNLYEKRARSRLSTTDDELARLTSDPKNRALFEKFVSAMSRRANALMTPAQKTSRGELGGAARAKSLTPKERSDIAKTGAIARWLKRDEQRKAEESGSKKPPRAKE
jgi:hypothetical protein